MRTTNERTKISYAGKIEDLIAERDSAVESMLSALRLVTDVRWALGDAGARMQPELIELARRLRKDAERLDWIERQYLDELSMRLVVDADHDGQYYVCGDSNKPGYGPTLRAAIDAAMAGQG